MSRSEAFIAEEGQVHFDVFLCHNSADKLAVRWTAERLRERGIRPRLDEDELRHRPFVARGTGKANRTY
jgi:hypothetical protein